MRSDFADRFFIGVVSMFQGWCQHRLTGRLAVLFSVFSVLLAACATDASREAFRDSESGLELAREHAAIHCMTLRDCAQAWNRARAFAHADRAEHGRNDRDADAAPIRRGLFLGGPRNRG